MSQTYALLVDAYRELNAKKLFWITMVLSALIIVVIGAIGISDKGYTAFGWSPEFLQDESLQYLTEDQLNEARSIFYKEVFNLVGITIWLTWAAIILAIFSTAGIFPELMTSGAIDTLLTKPISRLRLFLTKYLLGLGFVALQVAVFAVSAFLIIGIRASDWDPTMFLAIPIVLLFFSYLYAICVLVGVLTRSTLLAVILTVVAWLGMFVINMVDSGMLEMQAKAVVDAEIAETRADYMQTLPPRPEPEPEPESESEVQPETGPAEDAPAPASSQPEVEADQSPSAEDPSSVSEALSFDDAFDTRYREGYEMRWGDEATLRQQAEQSREMAESIEKYRGYGYLVKTPLPKTGETRELMTRLLRDEQIFEEYEFDPAQEESEFFDPLFGGYNQLVAARKFQLGQEQRPWTWIVFTSILFEIVVVGLAAWKFCRRDY